jgi:hypothetical protein
MAAKRGIHQANCMILRERDDDDDAFALTYVIHTHTHTHTNKTHTHTHSLTHITPKQMQLRHATARIHKEHHPHVCTTLGMSAGGDENIQNSTLEMDVADIVGEDDVGFSEFLAGGIVSFPNVCVYVCMYVSVYV